MGKILIKDFFESYKYKDEDDYCYVDLFDTYDGEYKKYEHVDELIADFGCFPIISWHLHYGALILTTSSRVKN